ncbi:hypothetical protein H5410_014725 [Solanum commersonii]|uniref:Uncharacterized protein n=1 Tax=Solanum commersonii TaxID=4109 RepID=A0A9J5ZRN6_SOLCO|nr:hypothetical protein H5410_014725 [Solanum commersonii]
MSFSRCAHATDDASRLWLMVYVIGRRHLSNAHTPELMLARPRQMPWLMLHAVGQRCLPDAHTP